MTTSATETAERPPLPLRRKLLYAMLVPVLLFVLGECALRIKSRIASGTWDHTVYFRDTGRDVFERHFHLGSVPVSGTDLRIGEMHVTIDERGFRGRGVAVPKPAGTFRIACLGGSAVFGTRNLTDDSTWPARLEAHLRERLPGRDLEVVNAGCSGYDSLASLINLQCRVLDLEPDLVVVYNAFNDLKLDRVGTFRSDHSNYDRLPRERSLLRILVDQSLLLLTLEHHLAKLRARGGNDTAGARFDTLDPAGPRAFRRNLESIAAICREHRVQLVLATFARPWEERIPESMQEGWVLKGFTPLGLARAYETYNAVIREVAEDEHVPLVDAAALVPRDPALFADAVHFNDAGADVMGGVVADGVAPLVR